MGGTASEITTSLVPGSDTASHGEEWSDRGFSPEMDAILDVVLDAPPGMNVSGWTTLDVSLGAFVAGIDSAPHGEDWGDEPFSPELDAILDVRFDGAPGLSASGATASDAGLSVTLG